MNRAQAWSARALEAVRSAKEAPTASQYGTVCMRFPGLVRQAGLIQALVYVEARRGAPGAGYLADLERVMGGQRLVARARAADTATYMALTEQVIEAAVWLRRFAQIELDADLEFAGAED